MAVGSRKFPFSSGCSRSTIAPIFEITYFSTQTDAIKSCQSVNSLAITRPSFFHFLPFLRNSARCKLAMSHPN